MTNDQIAIIKQQIDELQEYINTELCRKCDEMKNKLNSLKEIIVKYSQ